MKILFLGDSITEGVGASIHEKCYVSLIEKKLHAECVNYGVSGTRIARQKTVFRKDTIFNYDFNARLEIMEDEADLVIVFGGTNDYGHGTAMLGNENDKDVYTFSGAVNTLLSSVIKKYTREKVLFVIPIPRINEDSPDGEIISCKHGIKATLNDYRSIIIKSCQNHDIHYVDFQKEFIKDNQINLSLFSDGLHPNDSGHELLADLLIKEISSFQ